MTTQSGNNFGFTLIELILVVGLVGLLVAFLVPEFSVFNQRQILKSTVDRFIDGIKQTQNLAIGGVQGAANFAARYQFGFLTKIGDPADYYRGFSVKRFDEIDQEITPALDEYEAVCPICVNAPVSDFSYRVPAGIVTGLGGSQMNFNICYPNVGSYTILVDQNGPIERSNFQSAACSCPDCPI